MHKLEDLSLLILLSKTFDCLFVQHSTVCFQSFLCHIYDETIKAAEYILDYIGGCYFDIKSLNVFGHCIIFDGINIYVLLYLLVFLFCNFFQIENGFSLARSLIRLIPRPMDTWSFLIGQLSLLTNQWEMWR